MSKMFDYISGKSEGREAELEASLEHALGHLGVEIEENTKLRWPVMPMNDRIAALENALREVQAFIERRLPDEIGDALTETHDVLALIHHVLYDL